MTRIVALLGCLGSLSAPGLLTAGTVGLDVITGAEYTSNTLRTQADEIDELIVLPSAALSVAHATNVLDARLDYSAQRRIYEAGFFDDHTVATGNATLDWTAVENRLALVATHTRSQALISITDDDTPENHQHTTTTEAGPELYFSPAQDTTLRLSYQLGRRHAEVTEQGDADTASLVARFDVAATQRNGFSFIARRSEIDFDAATSPDISARTAMIGWSFSGSAVQTHFATGYSRARRGGDRRDLHGPHVEAQAEWQVGTPTSINARFVHELRDRSATLDSGVDVASQAFDAESGLAELFANTRALAEFSHDFSDATSGGISLSYNRENFRDVERDSSTLKLAMTVQRALRADLDFSASVGYDEQKLTDLRESSNTRAASVEFEWRPARRLSATLGIGYEIERGEDAAGNRGVFDHFNCTLRVAWRLLEPNG